nr:retrovirus-related Pol polyprotein from transposon TNT 1-94 [Tanacetum cinerariifolium]
GLRNANHTQTLDLADIYGRFVYENNQIQRSQADPKFQKDYKDEYKKMKAKLALLEGSPSSSQKPKTFQPKKKGTIFNANKEIVLITPRRNDVYVLDMSSLTPNGVCFFAKASESVYWLWHKRLSHLNFKNINKLAKQSKVLAERNNRTLIEAARTMMNGSVLSKHFWAEAVRITCYTQNRSIIVKRHDKTPYEIFRERIPDTSYFYVFRCLVFIHNHKDHLRKFDAKADDGYFLGYSFISKAFKVFIIRRQQVEETYHVTFDESLEAISSHPVPQDRWSRDQHIKLVNIIGDPSKCMLTRSVTAKHIDASASERLFADFLSKIEPKKVSEALKHPGWIDSMQEKLN